MCSLIMLFTFIFRKMEATAPGTSSSLTRSSATSSSASNLSTAAAASASSSSSIQCCTRNHNVSSSLNPCQCHMCFPALNNKSDRKPKIKLTKWKEIELKNDPVPPNNLTHTLSPISRVNSEPTSSELSARYG